VLMVRRERKSTVGCGVFFVDEFGLRCSVEKILSLYNDRSAQFSQRRNPGIDVCVCVCFMGAVCVCWWKLVISAECVLVRSVWGILCVVLSVEQGYDGNRCFPQSVYSVSRQRPLMEALPNAAGLKCKISPPLAGTCARRAPKPIYTPRLLISLMRSHLSPSLFLLSLTISGCVPLSLSTLSPSCDALHAISYPFTSPSAAL